MRTYKINRAVVEMSYKMDPTMLLHPGLTGLYAVGGLYIGRTLLGITKPPVNWAMVAVVAGTSLAGATVAPRLLPYVTCPESSSADLVEAGISSGVAWGTLSLLTGEPGQAGVFIPIQVASHLLASYMTPRILDWMEARKVKYGGETKWTEPGDEDEYTSSPYDGVSQPMPTPGGGNGGSSGKGSYYGGSLEDYLMKPPM